MNFEMLSVLEHSCAVGLSFHRRKSAKSSSWAFPSTWPAVLRPVVTMYALPGELQHTGDDESFGLPSLDMI